MNAVPPLDALSAARFERPDILKKLASASRALAELKGVAESIPHQGILINTLGLREAKDSSAIENIVTTHDELFREEVFPGSPGSAAAKEVQRYRQALRVGFDAVQQSGLLTLNHILAVQAELEQNSAGFRRVPGTVLRNPQGETVYEPPQDPAVVLASMSDLEKFINENRFDADPLVKMALIHHQFETVHPFYDGNGRTGRIVNVLYLVKEGLLDIPILYVSRYIVRTKSDYYRLLQAVRDSDAWEAWVVYMLTAVEESSRDAVGTIVAIRETLLRTKHAIRERFRFYSQDLINNLFTHPYTKIEFLQHDLGVTRLTASKYLTQLTQAGFLQKQKVGRSNYYINVPLVQVLAGDEAGAPRATAAERANG
jgi:Fic family protein